MDFKRNVTSVRHICRQYVTAGSQSLHCPTAFPGFKLLLHILN